MIKAKVPPEPHTLDAQAVAALLEVSPETGLSTQDALERLSRVGPNRLPQAQARPPSHVLLAQFKSILILILLGAAVLAALVGSTKDGLVILAVVMINARLGHGMEELKAKMAESIKPSSKKVFRVSDDMREAVDLVKERFTNASDFEAYQLLQQSFSLKESVSVALTNVGAGFGQSFKQSPDASLLACLHFSNVEPCPRPLLVHFHEDIDIEVLVLAD